MIAHTVLAKGHWRDQPRDTITLDEEDRHRRRLRMISDSGFEFLLSLEKATRLHHGDGLLLESGDVVEVIAKPEPLLKVQARDGLALLELAWHLGNRHQPTEIREDHLLIRRDRVIAAMLAGLGATITEVEAIFSPLNGAYDSRHDHQH